MRVYHELRLIINPILAPRSKTNNKQNLFIAVFKTIAAYKVKK